MKKATILKLLVAFFMFINLFYNIIFIFSASQSTGLPNSALKLHAKAGAAALNPKVASSATFLPVRIDSKKLIK